MAYDVQVLIQSFIYIVIFLFGFAVAIPLGVTVIEFNNNCVLFADWTWTNATYAQYELSSASLCNFPVFVSVFACVFYALGMAIYGIYAAIKSKDPNIGFQMWIMPFLLMNTLIALLMFVGACIISIGIKSLCDAILEGKELGVNISTCSDGAKIDWNKGKGTSFTYKHFFSYPKVSEVAGWVTFLLWASQVALCILRAIRNRRLRSKDMGSSAADKSTNGTSDLENFASANPSA